MDPAHEAEFRRLFEAEATEQLDRLADTVLELERAGARPELVATLFRDAHTLKSSAALVGLDAVGRIAHRLEDLLGELRSGARPATPELADGVLDVVDALRALVAAGLAGEPGEAHEAAADAGLRRAAATPAEAAVAAPAEQLGAEDATFRRLFAGEVVPELERLTQTALDVERRGAEPELVAALFRGAHSLKGSAAVVGFPRWPSSRTAWRTASTSSAAAGGRRRRPSSTRCSPCSTPSARRPRRSWPGRTPPRSWPRATRRSRPSGPAGSAAPEPSRTCASRSRSRRSLRRPPPDVTPEAEPTPEASRSLGSARTEPRVLAPGPRAAAGAEGPGAGGPAAGPGPRPASAAPVRRPARRATRPRRPTRHAARGARRRAGSTGRRPADRSPRRRAATPEAVVAPEAPAATPEPPAEAPPAAPPPTPEPSVAALEDSAPPFVPAAPATPGERLVPVGLDRLDGLVRVSGEAVAAQLRLTHLLREHIAGDPDAEAAALELRRALSGVQEQTMRTRMTTLAGIAGNLRRAARDVARASGKEVDYALAGDRVELDRAVLDGLRDPLLHLVRNAVDHGLEAPGGRARRRASRGSAPCGSRPSAGARRSS
jgi:chemotaxis protein histidine kinase CheA